jgi:hypothetical protein
VPQVESLLFAQFVAMDRLDFRRPEWSYGDVQQHKITGMQLGRFFSVRALLRRFAWLLLELSANRHQGCGTGLGFHGLIDQRLALLWGQAPEHLELFRRWRDSLGTCRMAGQQQQYARSNTHRQAFPTSITADHLHSNLNAIDYCMCARWQPITAVCELTNKGLVQATNPPRSPPNS